MILLTSDEIDKLTSKIALEIREKYKNNNPLLICVLKGSFIFFSDIVKKLSIPCTVDFIQVSSYGSSTISKQNIEFIKDISLDITDKDVIIVDDILDSGYTLYNLKEYFLNKRKAASVSICTLLNKPARRVCDITADYVGVEIPDEFVVGYGLDYDENYRNLPYIGILKREIYEKSH